MDVEDTVKKLNLKFRNIEGERLILAITCDENKNVLMVDFVFEEALKKTLETGYMHYYSTSRKKLWRKGEESGNVQKLIKFYRDCDGDALLFIVEQKGVACHEGYYSCFHYKIEDGELKITGEYYSKR